MTILNNFSFVALIVGLLSCSNLSNCIAGERQQLGYYWEGSPSSNIVLSHPPLLNGSTDAQGEGISYTQQEVQGPTGPSFPSIHIGVQGSSLAHMLPTNPTGIYVENISYPQGPHQGPTGMHYQIVGVQGPQIQIIPSGLTGPQAGIIFSPQGPTGMHYQIVGVQGGPTGGYAIPTPQDPAIQWYQSKDKSINAKDLENLLQKEPTPTLTLRVFNILNLEDFNFSEERLVQNLIERTDLDCIREINISKDEEDSANKFLINLFTNNKSLRSLVRVKAINIPLTWETLNTAKEQLNFNGPLIREMSKISGRYDSYVAPLEFFIGKDHLNKKLFPSEKRDLKVQLEKPREDLLKIKYITPSSAPDYAHLQLSLIGN